MFVKRYMLGLMTILIIAGYGSVAAAGEPMEKIRQTTDKIIAILTDPSLKGPEKEPERSRQIRRAVDERFDWEEMSLRTLARNWKDRTQAERSEFIGLFGNLLERTYLDKVESYSGEKVLYVDEKTQGDYALVTVKIITQQQTDIQVQYRLKRKGSEWLVYDISIEGVSLVNNYRKQFSSILAQSSYKDLVDRLRAKVEGKE